MRRKNWEAEYFERTRKQTEELRRFAQDEELNAGFLIDYYRRKERDMPDDIYRACAFFINKEYLYKNKSGALSLLCQTEDKRKKESPAVTKENYIDILCYKYQLFAAMLRQGGFR
jgi:hypothetical protein